MAENTCLYSTVRNISGKELSFSFLGDHGVRLVANESTTHRGNIITQLARAPRKFNALKYAVENGLLALEQTPSVHLWDDTNDEVKVLVLDGGTLGTADPCWGSYSSSMGSLSGSSSSSGT